MCKYCKGAFTGNVNEAFHEVELEINGLPLIGVQTLIDDATILLDVSEAINGRSLARARLLISYCPVCGRKLSLKEES